MGFIINVGVIHINIYDNGRIKDEGTWIWIHSHNINSVWTLKNKDATTKKKKEEEIIIFLEPTRELRSQRRQLTWNLRENMRLQGEKSLS